MRRNSVTPLASPEPTKKPRINSFEEHVASASAVPSCLPPEVPAQLPGQVRQPRLPRLGPRVPRPGGEGGPPVAVAVASDPGLHAGGCWRDGPWGQPPKVVTPRGSTSGPPCPWP